MTTFYLLRYFANHIRWSLLLTFIIVALWHLINDQIMVFWSVYSVICLLVQVFTLIYHMQFMPCC